MSQQKQDKFADLLSSFNTNKKVNQEKLEKLSLSERQKSQISHQNGNNLKKNNDNGSWSGLDLLESNKKNNKNISRDSGLIGGSASTSVSNLNEFEFLSSTVKSEQAVPTEASKIDVGQDDFAIFNGNGKDGVYSTEASSMNNLFGDEDFTDAFPNEEMNKYSQVSDSVQSSQHSFRQQHSPPRPERPQRPHSSANAENGSAKRDESLAELVEMGFDVERANEALNNTSDGINVQEAISYILNEAHRNSNLKSKSHSNKIAASHNNRNEHNNNRPSSAQDELDLDIDIGQAVNELTSELKTKAFSLFSKGRETLAKGIEMYREQQFQQNDNQPIWMKNQAIYKSRSMKEQNEDYEGGDDFDQQQMRKIVELQRLKDKKLRAEKEREEAERRRRARAKNGSDGTNISRHSSLGRNSDNNITKSSASSSKFDDPLPSRNRRRFNNNQESESQSDKASIKSSNSQPIPATQASVSNNNLNTQQQNILESDDPFAIFNVPNPPVSSGSSPSTSRQSPSKQKNSVDIPEIAISQEAIGKFNSLKELGNDFYKKGDFSSALEQYQLSLNTLPLNHRLTIIALSNLSNVYAKLGNSKETLANVENAMNLINSYNIPISKFNELNIDENKPLKPIWIKLLTRKAEGLEHMEKFKDALESYNLLIENGGMSKAVMDGKKRCLDILQPKSSKPKTKPTQKSQSMPKSEPKPKTSTFNENNNENLQKFKQQSNKTEIEENERFALHDKIEEQLNNWKLGKEDNLRALLASLDKILWKELNWKPVSIADLVLNKKVKIIYLKAVSKTHPDKISSDATVEQKMIAQAVFVVLNQAWDKFKTANNMQ
ncbi:hypothetical protein PACTADRAFT_3521 [Pachysolen tannophilus NRRL Y-2460]|uniref:UBA domain-containing protein n=1 Tax=Pachysolen tannophilus NRRL Y-2460 TaxID=669874 RepID=A0A1E4TSB9_PACTA|nr:hypothetical protein PACTADRAFT_3521 [Pachysolen tannophilus NRRL Y-2460]